MLSQYAVYIRAESVAGAARKNWSNHFWTRIIGKGAGSK